MKTFAMPGANCSIFGCSTSRKSKGTSIFRVPTGDDEYSQKWRQKIVHIDHNLKRQIENKSLHTCELHYPEECLLRNTNKTTRIPGSLPTLKMLIKTFKKTNIERPTSSISKRDQFKEDKPSDTVDCYKQIQFLLKI
jgi:hypothetical protein